jgi:hypothetical protein
LRKALQTVNGTIGEALELNYMLFPAEKQKKSRENDT